VFLEAMKSQGKATRRKIKATQTSGRKV